MSNYDNMNLKIRIPIEIIPKESGVKEAIEKQRGEELKGRLREGREAGRETGGAWGPTSEGLGSIYSDDAYRERSYARPTSKDWVQPGKGAPRDMDYSGFKSPDEKMNRYAKGKAPYSPDHGSTGENVPLNSQIKATGNVPLSDKVFKELKIKRGSKIPNPNDVGVHVYDPGSGGMLEDMFSKVFGGPAKAQGVIRNLKNPSGMIMSVLSNPIFAPIVAGLVAIEVSKMIIAELIRKGGLFDRTFKNFVDNRISSLRTRELQMEHYMGMEGLSQLITTTNAGNTNPRYAYNTHDEDTRQKALDEDKFGIRATHGVE